MKSLRSHFLIPYTNFSPKNKQIKQELLDAFEEVLDSGRYI